MPFKPVPSPSCVQCGKSVYFNEEVKFQDRSWHKECLKCKTCSKKLEIGGMNDHEGDIYCQQCHRKNFGVRGYGYGIGAGSLTSD
ncbi:muscle LIM protein 1-like [Symsagittifera roscoffensis]|uniref:muscle LIM protein 1-like n=1 Tax=Symsagittifera roscoffensis TaxID=84072 RepID=UPI00307B4826